MRITRQLSRCAQYPLWMVLMASGAADAGAAERFRIQYEGRALTYVEQDGLAIAEGDILLGSATAMAQLRAAPLARKALVTDNASRLWPTGPTGVHEVPYVFEAGPQANVDAAVASFNATFAGIIQWVPRSAQDAYVAFSLTGPAGSCFSQVGRTGGRQIIGGSPVCSTGALLHEMGHAIGFWHTQSDTAQGSYLNILYDAMDPLWRPQYEPNVGARTLDGYDYGSIMHYGPFVASTTADPITSITLPPGIDTGLRLGYSAADIDAVKRLYDAAPMTVVVATNPAGLAVTVDGVTGVTPLTFNWRIGSLHRLDVPAGLQDADGYRYAFGRWNHDPGPTPAAAQEWIVQPGAGYLGQPVTAPASGVLVANFVRLVRVQQVVSGSAFGQFSAASETGPWPGTTDWYPQLTRFDLSAQPNDGFLHTWVTTRFQTLTGGSGGASVASRRILAASPMQIGAAFFAAPAIVLRAEGPGVDGTLRANITPPGSTQAGTMLVPNVLRGAQPGSFTIAADAVQTRSDSVRFSLQSITGLDDPDTGAIEPPAAGGNDKVVTLAYRKEFAPVIERNPSCGGSVTLSNKSAWIPFGTGLAAHADPVSGVVFAGWRGTFSGDAPDATMTVDRVPEAVAYFNTIAEPFVLSSVSPTTIRLGGGPFTLEFKGSGFTANNTFVSLENGAQRGGTVVDSRTLRVTLTDADFSHAGKFALKLGAFMGIICTGTTDPVSIDILPAVAPRLVTVHEFYNAGLDRYFRTASDEEAAAIRANPATGEQDTGQPFKAWASTAHPDAALAVFRFYGSVSPGPNSHFFTANADEARDLQRAQLDTPASDKRWNYEELAFAIKVPANGACPADAPVKVYRVYNDGFARGRDSNHRYVTDVALYGQMLARGWLGEGVAMCAPA